jgi:4,5-DOPA dioxygenase extradiol
MTAAAPGPMPALFVGHGSPMNALEDNQFTGAWRALGASVGRPRAVLCVSAHWYVRGTRVTAMAKPPTIHDFGGFPRALFELEYPAPGDPGLAAEVRDLLASPPAVDVALDAAWGLDHGAWSVLVHMFPAADVPVVQLSVDGTRPASFHYELGARLAALRARGVLVVGSGNIVHNLDAFVRRGGGPEPYDWAVRFDAEVRRRLEARDHAPLVAYETLGPDARLAVPTPDHYLPLLYVIGQAGREPVSYPVEGFQGGGAISMLSVRVG